MGCKHINRRFFLFSILVGVILLMTPGSADARGGYVTPVNLSFVSETSYWQGYFGEINVGITPGANTANATGGDISEVDLYFYSNCSISSIEGNIYASTSSSIQWTNITGGSANDIDTYLGISASNSESATKIFTGSLNYSVGSQNLSTLATYTFVNQNPSTVFDTGVLSDAANNVYVTHIQDNSEGFEAENLTHDFQLIVPAPLGSTVSYYFTAELEIICAPMDFSISSEDVTVSDSSPQSGETITVTATVHNNENGSYVGIPVVFLVDGVRSQVNSIDLSGNSQSQTQFSWTATSGTHTLQVWVDPDDIVVETNEANNNVITQVTSTSPPTPREYMYIRTDGNCANHVVEITVEDEDDESIYSVDIVVYFEGNVIRAISTDTSGKTEFTPVVAGTYLLSATKSGYYDRSKTLFIMNCESCLDNILNQDETDIDCGGLTCSACYDNRTCMINSDCQSGWCYLGVCKTSSCTDGIKGPGELGADCGGVCSPCESCADNTLNQDETDIDCGGTTCGPCGLGLNCSLDYDCVSGLCVWGVCSEESCFDGIRNQNETSIDCGGSCGPCDLNEGCDTDDDCTSRWCYNGTCRYPNCFDGFKNGVETGVDCGGVCLPCTCFNSILDGDERGIDCGGPCPSCGCFNGVLDGNETDTDCGGDCAECTTGNSCEINHDCQSNWCFNGICRETSCDDDIKGPGEEGVDCGGPCIACHCFNNELDEYEEGIDCGGECPSCRKIRIVTNETESGETQVIVYNTTSMCLNGKRDRSETDIDCGGKCRPCEQGLICMEHSDCLSGWCANEVCRVSSCSDNLLGPKEEKIDCGGPCQSCPWIKVNSSGRMGELLNVVVINPRDDLYLQVKEPSGETTIYAVKKEGLSTYQVIPFEPRQSGLHLIRIEGYDEKYVKIKNRINIPIIDELPEEVQSLLIPLLILGIIWWKLKNRRKYTVIDTKALHRYIFEDLLTAGLLKKYSLVYTASDVSDYITNDKIIYVELSETEIEDAEGLSEKYVLGLEDSKALVLCRKMHANRLISSAKLSEEIKSHFEGTKIIEIRK